MMSLCVGYQRGYLHSKSYTPRLSKDIRSVHTYMLTYVLTYVQAAHKSEKHSFLNKI